MTKTFNKKIKIAVAMSGGVDSGVAAALLVRQGFDCTGFHMHLWSENIDFLSHDRGKLRLYFENKCCSTESLEAARKTAHLLGISFYTIDFSEIFKKRVVDYFLREYAAGLTPNPCVMCNKFVKFGELLGYVRRLGFDYLATGHYARVEREVRAPLFSETRAKVRGASKLNTLSLSDSPIRRMGGDGDLFLTADQYSSKRVPSPLYHLLMAADKSKDQSYFLYNLTQSHTQSQLAHILFPVGDYPKKEVVRMAKKWQLPVAHRPESQEICFFPETDYRPFLCRQIPEKIKEGPVVDLKGRIIGKHYGLPLYTIGQRHGFVVEGGKWEVGREVGVGRGIVPPYYVIGKETKSNRLIVGFGKEAEREEFWVRDVNWINPKLKIFVRIRHQGELLKLKTTTKNLKLVNQKIIKVVLDEPERGIAPGQAAVFYSPITNHYSLITNYEVLGGGIIEMKNEKRKKKK